MNIIWKKIQPEYGEAHHTFKLRAGKVVVIDAFTRMGLKKRNDEVKEPLWSWRINGAKPVNNFWTEEEARNSATELLELMVIDLKEQLE